MTVRLEQAGCLDVTPMWLTGDEAGLDWFAFDDSRSRKPGIRIVSVGLAARTRFCPTAISTERGRSGGEPN
jgi:hypothetical protein